MRSLDPAHHSPPAVSLTLVHCALHVGGEGSEGTPQGGNFCRGKASDWFAHKCEGVPSSTGSYQTHHHHLEAPPVVIPLKPHGTL